MDLLAGAIALAFGLLYIGRKPWAGAKVAYTLGMLILVGIPVAFLIGFVGILIACSREGVCL
jgi:hypothetical protein